MTRWALSGASQARRPFSPTALSRPQTSAQAPRPTPTTLTPRCGFSAYMPLASSSCHRPSSRQLSTSLPPSLKATPSSIAATWAPSGTASTLLKQGAPFGERDSCVASRFPLRGRRCPANAPPNPSTASCAPSTSSRRSRSKSSRRPRRSPRRASRKTEFQLAQGRSRSAPRRSLPRRPFCRAASPRACQATLPPQALIAAFPRSSLRSSLRARTLSRRSRRSRRSRPGTSPPPPRTTPPSRDRGQSRGPAGAPRLTSTHAAHCG
mmetsp:Transcript_10879/g.26391  ORF Transcript_10879/g.26391 Transcript_10879/m.26391 type:complete len:265 (+) Transcript_10879:179-973(+)